MQRPVSQNVVARPVEAGQLIFRVMLAAALVAAFAQITLGGFVRVFDAGLACADDWPLCDGQWIPAFTGDVILEYTHRLTAVLLGIFILAAVVIGWRVHRDSAVVFGCTLAAFALVIAAGALGWATVITELSWSMRLIHLAIAELLIASLAFALVAVWPVNNPPLNGPPRSTMLAVSAAIALMLLFTFLLLVSGSIVVGEGASTACGSWPLCSGSMIIPSGDVKFALHMSHRIVSVVTGLIIVVVALWVWRMREWWPGAGVCAIVLAALLVGQVFIGAANPWSAFAPVWKGLHVSAATAVWLAAAVLAALVHVPRMSGVSEPNADAERFRGVRSLIQW